MLRLLLALCSNWLSWFMGWVVFCFSFLGKFLLLFLLFVRPLFAAWKAQHRLHKRYIRLAAAGKDQRKIITAVGRELLGFVWAIGTKAEAAARQRIAA